MGGYKGRDIRYLMGNVLFIFNYVQFLKINRSDQENKYVISMIENSINLLIFYNKILY